MARYLLAGLLVEMTPRYPKLKTRSQPYLAESDKAADIIIGNDIPADFGVDTLNRMSPENKEYLVMGSRFSKNLLLYDGLVLHASAVVADDGRAYLFAAPSGTGKSTHTRFWLEILGDGAFILNDDKPAVRICENGVRIFGTPFSGKHDMSRNTSAPLGGICFISRGAENKIRRLDIFEAVPLLLGQTLRPKSEKYMSRLLKTADELLHRAPAYKMSCNLSVEAAELAYTVMRKGSDV